MIIIYLGYYLKIAITNWTKTKIRRLLELANLVRRRKRSHDRIMDSLISGDNGIGDRQRRPPVRNPQQPGGPDGRHRGRGHRVR